MKHPLNPQFCACGCGEITSGKRKWGANRYVLYIKGHEVRGKTWKLSGEALENNRAAAVEKTRKALKPLVDYCLKNDLDMVEFVRSEYWDEDKSVRQIAEEHGVSTGSLTTYMKRNDIPRRNITQINQWKWDHPTERMIEQSAEWHQGGVEWMQSDEGRQINSQNRLRDGFTGNDETRRKISVRSSGSKSHFWVDGSSRSRGYPPEFNEILKRSIRERDEYTCQECGRFGKQIHHIDYDKDNSDEMNLITLCRSCHVKTSHKNREQWTIHFQSLIANRFELEEG